MVLPPRGPPVLHERSKYCASTWSERCGFSVPRELSVVGFDDLDWSRHLRPSLTTIQVPIASIWQRAGEYLVRHLAGEQTIMHHQVDHALIVRESTAPPKQNG